MPNFKIYDDSRNYTATVVKLTNTFELPGLDKLVGVSVFGHTCIIPKTYDLNQLYVFFPSETQLSDEFLKQNNLYRNSNLNEDMTQKGYFEENGRVKAIKLKGNISTGVVMPVSSVNKLGTGSFHAGDEFNEVDGVFICKKYIIKKNGTSGTAKAKIAKVLDDFIDSKLFPQHIDTEHLLKNLQRLNAFVLFTLTYKLHGTSARVAYTLVKRKLSRLEKIARWLGVNVVEEEYNYVVGSRRVVKSIGFNELKNKQHYYEEDLWTRVSKELFGGKLHKGEAVYFEIIGKDYTGAEIQSGYAYGLNEPKVYVYRISNINPNGVEVDLGFNALMVRCKELGVDHVPLIYTGSLIQYLRKMGWNEELDWREFLENHLKSTFMDAPSILDNSVVEEGICFRSEAYPRPFTFKMKSPKFLLHEGHLADKQVSDVETTN